MSATESPVLVSLADQVLTLTLNRPKAMNAIDCPMGEALGRELEAAAHDPKVRVVVITGTGRAFCAGGDLRLIMETNRERPAAGLRELAGLFHRGIKLIRTLSKPVVAAINGAAAGGGFSLALACDLRVMASSAFLQQGYTSAGLALDGGGSFSLPRLVGLARALEIAFLDERIPASRALDLGLVNQVAPDAEFPEMVRKLSERLAQRPTATLGRVKQMLTSSFETSLDVRLSEEQDAIALTGDLPEGREGVGAFLEKRPADFRKVGG